MDDVCKVCVYRGDCAIWYCQSEVIHCGRHISVKARTAIPQEPSAEERLAQLRNDVTPLVVLTRELLECWASGKAPDAELVAETMAALAKVTGARR